MPFTPAHAVVALPFVRAPRFAAAVAVGAMTPDLPLFTAGVGITYGRTHAWAWLPATVLVGAVLLLAWRCVLRPAVRELAPLPIAARLPRGWDGAATGLRETFGTVRTTLWTAAALTIGIATHILWDSFTHAGRAGVDLVPALAQPWGPLPGYKWLQYGSAVVGLAVIGIWMTAWLIRRAPEPPNRVVPDVVRWIAWASLPIVLASAWLIGMAVLGPLSSSFTVAHLAYRVLPPACGAWGIAVVALCAVVQGARARSSHA